MTKNILSLSIALAGACTLSLSAVAQDAKPGAGGPGGGRQPPSAEQRLNHLKESLTLTDDQAAKIKPILEKAQESGKTIHDDAALKPEEKRAKFEELSKSTHDEIDAILTPEQKEKQKADMEKRRAERGNRGPGGAGAAK